MSHAVAMLSIHTSPLDSPGSTKDAGGMNVYMRELAQKLASYHSRVDIFTRRTDTDTPQIVQLGENVRVIHIQAGPVAPLHKNDLYQYTPTFARYIDEFRRNESMHYDLIHSHYWLSGVAATRLACHWNIPHMIMFHTLGRLKQLANPKEPEPLLRLELASETWSRRSAWASRGVLTTRESVTGANTNRSRAIGVLDGYSHSIVPGGFDVMS